MKVALVYDRVNKWGGAERVLLAFHKLFPDAPLYTSVYEKNTAKWAKVFDVRTSFLQKIPFASSNHEFVSPLMPLVFESLVFDKYDLVISVTSESAKGIITKPGTIHICYCLTPTRYLWSGYDDYFQTDFLKILSKPIISRLQKWDIIASSRPDAYIGISKEVQRRIKKYYGRESQLVYPPAILKKNQESLQSGRQVRIRNQENYFLVVSRLSKFTKYKRIDLVIEAANELKFNLKIVGEGSWKNDLEKIAGSSVEFIGAINDADLIDYYKNCKALIFPGVEDFGLVMVEAGMHGKPVIAFKKGGAREIVIDGSTGLFFDEQNKESLMESIVRFEKIKFRPNECIINSERFNFESFKKNFLSVVNKLI
ncbi:MAG TPA: glycosyltransferase [Candidatus Limnocylindrales bacterium]|nr:glycosyltransferase [Candidatus Limnocylindrales bacterium]